ncbi:hypothetical protein BS47DRAFT_581164 [Hydnum rufescens UP504]|uniref:Uncharacterized protein n=1 Tax=Hydnum rufescens UP504 TaxID=1448309 RepID=A0A9P6DI13_9AGAM|nr:hypothetical protein BS47DRAFT_581164 [Hydnum rufescens UP504]
MRDCKFVEDRTVVDNRFSPYKPAMSANTIQKAPVFPLFYHRTVAPLDLVPFLKLGSPAAPELDLVPFIPRPPSTLPEPGDVHVQVIFGEEKGWGRSSFVHEVNVLPTTTLPAHLPPLVLKVARSKRRAEIGREAWFYDELECLQGVVLPRCYGWFEAELAEGQSFAHWTGPNRRSSRTESSNPEWLFEGSRQLKEMSDSRNYVSCSSWKNWAASCPEEFLSLMSWWNIRYVWRNC